MFGSEVGVLTGSLDLCAAEGIVGGTSTSWRDSGVELGPTSCRSAANCTSGQVCYISEDVPKVCNCVNGGDECYAVGTCTWFCELESTKKQVLRLNAGAKSCDPNVGEGGETGCDEGHICVAKRSCSHWACDTTSQSLVSAACTGKCRPGSLVATGAQVSNDGSSVVVTLNAYATALTNARCSRIFDAAAVELIGGSALCTASDDSLTIKLASTATLSVGASLSILATGSALVSQVDDTAAFTGSVTVVTCSNCTKPKAAIAGPAAVTKACDGGGLLSVAGSLPPSFDASLSSDPSGRSTWSNVLWSLDGAVGLAGGRAVLQAAVDRANAPTTVNDRLVLSLLSTEVTSLVEGPYRLQLTVTSWLGTSHTAALTFSKQNAATAPAVKVNLFRPPPIPAVHGQFISLRASASFAGVANSQASDDVTMTAVGSAPSAKLTGAGGDVADNAVILLSALGSSDPDSSTTKLTYKWDCRREDFPAPCFTGSAMGDNTTTPGVYLLPPSLLTLGKKHTVTVTVSKPVRQGASPLRATASVTFRPRSASEPFPRGKLERMCSSAECAFAHSTNKDLVLQLTLDKAYRKATVAWQSDELESVSALTARTVSAGTYLLTIPAASLPSGVSSITVTANLALNGIDGASIVTVPLNAAPFCSLSPASPSACVRVTLASDTFPKAVATLRVLGWADAEDTQLTYEFGIRSDKKGDVSQQVAVSTSSPIVGLSKGNNTLYACARDSQAARTCGTVVVFINSPGADFDATSEMRGVNLNTLSGDPTEVQQAAAQLSLLMSEMSDPDAAAAAADPESAPGSPKNRWAVSRADTGSRPGSARGELGAGGSRPGSGTMPAAALRIGSGTLRSSSSTPDVPLSGITPRPPSGMASPRAGSTPTTPLFARGSAGGAGMAFSPPSRAASGLRPPAVAAEDSLGDLNALEQEINAGPSGSITASAGRDLRQPNGGVLGGGSFMGSRKGSMTAPGMDFEMPNTPRAAELDDPEAAPNLTLTEVAAAVAAAVPNPAGVVLRLEPPVQSLREPAAIELPAAATPPRPSSGAAGLRPGSANRATLEAPQWPGLEDITEHLPMPPNGGKHS
ncbi:hypothetical protein GPECTOR_451g350 [Gonium pectorale]|uniref:PKD/REJ-like domain-containing protein n=1 Tax=Gonium pectorale TaxID=33097 RepID=A0A150FW84_GONPE|nr:hypothetical protein GPECTOR_451g350 [Gonium pectorale]|eukprot:KXZ41465.1 hypothetical protein GPECTOR_451g350 [Gonium pectorale]